MTGIALFALVVGLIIVIPLILTYIYGVFLAVRLMCKGEWQWFCLPFIAVPLSLVGKAIETMPFVRMAPDEVHSNIIWAFSAMILVALLSGFAVYWLMWRYRKETVFVHFYAASYFLCAAVFLCFIASFNAELLKGLSAILWLYGFITGLAGVAVMRKRVKRYRKASQNYERELPAKSGESAEYPQQSESL